MKIGIIFQFILGTQEKMYPVTGVNVDVNLVLNRMDTDVENVSTLYSNKPDITIEQSMGL